MKIYQDTEELKNDLRGILEFLPDNLAVSSVKLTAKIIDWLSLVGELIDDLIYTYIFTDNNTLKNLTCRIIHATATASGVIPTSIQKFYEAVAQGVYTEKIVPQAVPKAGLFLERSASGMTDPPPSDGWRTVPAINIRGITYEVARAVFRAAIKNKVGAFIFEIARSEIGYTKQEPEEYATAIIAAGIKEGYQGPVFIQGDHFQVKSKKYLADPDTEITDLKNLIRKSIKAGFYNIDIDASTLVDLNKQDVGEQQETNSKVTAELTEFIRQLQPPAIIISVGGEIGEVGKQNSTPEELRAFMKQYRSYLKTNLPCRQAGLTGISKISVQTGTSHGGVPLPNGSIATVNLDFDTLRELSHIARQEFGLAGAVQHGASTLPDGAFDKFPQNDTAEVHLATGFQNMIYDSPHFPKELLNEINSYLIKNHADERKPQDTEEQFIYKTRKKAFGPFKKKMWDLPSSELRMIMKTLEDKFGFLFRKLNVQDTVVAQFIKPKARSFGHSSNHDRFFEREPGTG